MELTQNSFPDLAQHLVRLVHILLVLRRNLVLSSVDQNGLAPLEDAFGRAFHNQQVRRFSRSFIFVDGYLEEDPVFGHAVFLFLSEASPDIYSSN